MATVQTSRAVIINSATDFITMITRQSIIDEVNSKQTTWRAGFKFANTTVAQFRELLLGLVDFY